MAGGWDGPYFKNLVAGAQWPVVSRQPRGQQLRSVDPPSTIVQPSIVTALRENVDQISNLSKRFFTKCKICGNP